MKTLLFLGFVLFFVVPAEAQEIRIGAGFTVGYLIAGDSAEKGRRANPTGGIAVIPHAQIAVSTGTPWLDVAYVQSPMVIAPLDERRRGFVDANDLGPSFHPANRAWSLFLAPSVLPAYALFCNVQWCLREGLVMTGGVVKMVGNVLQNKDGTGLHVDLVGRVIYAQPTAWTWPGLSEEDRRIIPTMVMINGGAHWVW